MPTDVTRLGNRNVTYITCDYITWIHLTIFSGANLLWFPTNTQPLFWSLNPNFIPKKTNTKIPTFYPGFVKQNPNSTRNPRSCRTNRSMRRTAISACEEREERRVKRGGKWHVRKRSKRTTCLKAWVRVTELYLQRTTERWPVRKPLIALPSFRFRRGSAPFAYLCLPHFFSLHLLLFFGLIFFYLFFLAFPIFHYKI